MQKNLISPLLLLLLQLALLFSPIKSCIIQCSRGNETLEYNALDLAIDSELSKDNATNTILLKLEKTCEKNYLAAGPKNIKNNNVTIM